MEQERIAREKEEQEKKLKEQKMKEEFGDASGQWEMDKQKILEKQKQQGVGNEKPVVDVA